MNFSILTIVSAVFALAACSSTPTDKLAEPTRTPALQAEPGLEQLYEAINVQEVDARQVDERGNPSLGAMIMEKSVGGLKCRKTTVVVPNAVPSYFCMMSSASDATLIYKALDVREFDPRPLDSRGNPPLGAIVTAKTIGKLTCTKSVATVPRPKPKYSCSGTL